MSVQIECPSGLVLQIRALKGREAKLLTDKNAIRQGVFLDNILNACTEGVVDPGIYQASAPNKPFDWGQVLIGDRMFALIKIREATFGSEYGFKVQCKDGLCRERFDYLIDLEQLGTKPLSQEDQEVMRGDGVFTTTLSDGKEVKYKLARGLDEKLAARSRSTDTAVIEMLSRRIVSIEGVGEVKQSDISSGRVVKGVRTYLEDLDWSELVKLLRRLDSHDCGVETEISIECPKCGGVQETQLPFERNFFLPMEGNET